MRFLQCKNNGQKGQPKIAESRLVFLNIGQESASMAQKLERDLEALRLKLEDAQDLKERATIQAEIKALLVEKADLTGIAVAELPPSTESLLLHGLGNRIEEINEKINKENLIDERRRLIEKKMRCLQALEIRSKAINGQKELEAACKGIETDDFFIKNLQGPDFDYQHLGDLLRQSDIAPFFDNELVAELEKTEQRIITNDWVEETLRPTHPDNIQASAESWITFKAKNEVVIAAIEARDLVTLQKYLPHLVGVKKLEEGSPEDRRLQDYKQHLIAQRDNQEDYLHKQLLKREIAGKNHLIHLLPRSLAEKTQKLIVEAREIRMEQMRQYLKGLYHRLKIKYQSKKKLFSAKQQREMDLVFELGERDWIPLLNDLENIRDFAERLKMMKGSLGESVEGLEEVQSNLGGIAKNIRDQFEKVKTQIQQFTPTRIADLMEIKRKEEVKRLTHAGKPPRPEKSGIEALKAQSPIFKKDMKMLERLGGPEFAGYVLDFEQNRLPELENLEPGELQAASNELQTIYNSLGEFKNFGEKLDDALDPSRMADAQKAREAIQQIAHAKSVEEVRGILEELGPNRVQYVSHQQFESNYRRYTTTGHMVFYERGEEWGIILDESALRDKDNLRKLQKQITHELLHLEFEKSDELKSMWTELYTGNPQWPAIKQAFVDAFPSKTPPDFEGVTKSQYAVSDWSDEAVMSELYAMQNELGREPVFDKSPVGKLNNLIFNAGIGAAALAKEAGKSEPQAIYRGFEDGVDEAHMHKAMGHAEAEHGEGGGHGGHEISQTAEGAYKQYQDDIDMRDKELKELIESEYVGYIPAVGSILHLMKKYLDRTKTLNQKLRETGSGFLVAEVKDRLDTLKKEMVEIAGTLANIGAKLPNEKIGPFRKFWLNLTFLSISDIIQTGHQVVEYIERRHKRKEEENAAKLGMALFGKTTLGREAMAQKLKAEEAEVHEWQERYHHMDAFELFELIDQIADAAITPNKDQLKAILRLLAEKGRLDWRQPGLWKALNKLQSAVHLTPGDPVLMRNVPLLRRKLHTAIGTIWEFDEYLKLDKQNDDTYESGKKKFEPLADSIQANLTERMGQMLKQHIEEKHHHGYSQVDPQEFEEMIEYAITKGKSNAEATMFYLMAGMIHGLLKPDRGMVLDKNLNQWPATQWIYSKEPPLGQEDFKTYAEKYFGDDFRKGEPGWQFKNFYWTQIQNDEMTLQRVRKSVDERGWDHDWSRTIIALGDASTVKRWLSGKSGQEAVKPTAIENGMVGFLTYLEENAKVADRIDFRKHFNRAMGAVTMADGILDDVHPMQGAPFTRMNSSIANASAREVGMGHHKEWTVQEHRDKMQQFLSLFDKPLFELLRNQQKAHDNPDGLATEIRNYLNAHYPGQSDTWNTMKTIIHVFDKTDLIIKAVTDQYSDAEFLKRIKWLRSSDPAIQAVESDYHVSGGGGGHGGH